MRKWFLRHYESDHDFRLTTVCMFVFALCWVVFGIVWMVFDVAKGLTSQAVTDGIGLLIGFVVILLFYTGIAALLAVMDYLQKRANKK